MDSMTMAEIADICMTSKTDEVEIELATMLGQANLLVVEAVKSKLKKDKTAAEVAKDKCERTLSTLMILRSVHEVWGGMPVGRTEFDSGNGEGYVYGPMGTDRPNRSGYIDEEEGGTYYVAGGNLKGTSVSFHTFSTDEINAISIIRSWIVHGRTPTDN